MKKFVLSAVFMMAAWMGANAMSFNRAQAEALYLTDKMAYELNLNDQQYNDAYEINLDYFLRVDSPSDLYGDCYSYRLNDFRCILHDWQYSLLTAVDYFLRPVVWRAGGWFFPIYSHYSRDYFYYSRPSVWRTYYGGHSRLHHHGGFYANRRPHWDGGLRGHDMHRPHHNSGHGSHPGMSGHRGNSFNGSGHGHSGNSLNGSGHGHSGNSFNGSGHGHRGNSFSGSSHGHSGNSFSGSSHGHSGNSFSGSGSRMGGGSHGNHRSSGYSGGSRGGGSRGGSGSRGSSRRGSHI